MKSAWAAVLQESLTERIEKVPAGWHTTQEVARQIDRSMPHTSSLLRSWVSSGKAEMRKFRVSAGSIVRPVPHYRLKSK